MINNYLDFVKRARKYMAVSMWNHRIQARLVNDEWAKGFYRGLAAVNASEAHRWRILQKDIEAHAKRGDTLAWIPDGKGLIRT